jgi:hypothetical protein
METQRDAAVPTWTAVRFSSRNVSFVKREATGRDDPIENRCMLSVRGLCFPMVVRLPSGLSLHGFWLANWLRSAPRTAIQEMYQRLGDLVTDGSLSVAMEHVYPLDQFKDAIKQSLRANRSGKILFKFGANDRVRANMDNGLDAEKPGFSLTRNQL